MPQGSTTNDENKFKDPSYHSRASENPGFTGLKRHGIAVITGMITREFRNY